MSILKNIRGIKGVSTAHGIGIKQVLLSSGDTESAVTQIAVTALRDEEEVEVHIHPTMDEHYIILEGNGKMFFNGNWHVCRDGDYLLITKGDKHAMKAKSNMKFITIGIAYDK
ncbi:MAG: cupin domain-containing protein [Prevotella sp.]